jgi:hypothetical protein
MRSAEPRLLVENALAPGTHRFALVVVDAAGNESAPAVLEVQVTRPLRPGIPIDRPIGRVIDRGPVRPLPGPLRPGGPR